MPDARLAQRLTGQKQILSGSAAGRPSRVARFVFCFTALLSTFVVSSCGSGSSDLTVFAAISLREPMEEIAAAYEGEHPDIDVTFNFAGSQRLRFQLEQGAPADVFVSADERQMELAEESHLLAGEPAVFAGNRLVVAVAEDNPGGISGLEDLASPGVRLVWADEAVPLGKYANAAVSALSEVLGVDFPRRVEANIVSREESAGAVVGKVELGEADAAVVYETDASRLEGEGATMIPIPDDFQPAIAYLAASLGDAEAPEPPLSFVDFLLSQEAQQILIGHGFLGVR